MQITTVPGVFNIILFTMCSKADCGISGMSGCFLTGYFLGGGVREQIPDTA